jgi:ABC-type nickel/cobalt efflux system permease component RcnA
VSGFLATVGGNSLRIGIAASAAAFGFRHGIDWDHLAALSDIAGSQPRPRRSMFLSTLYALGHAFVILVMGLVAIAVSERFPTSVDTVMERLVGLTLIVLGVYVVVGLARRGRDFRLRSRWAIVGSGLSRTARWLTQRRVADPVVIEHEHEHDHAPDGVHIHDHVHQRSLVHVGSGASSHVHSHSHSHLHVVPMPDEPNRSYGAGTALCIGMLHGIGAETPTQVLIFVTAAGAAGTAVGGVLLACFIAGLLASNTVVALAATFGFLHASRSFPVYAAISLLTALASLTIGGIFLIGGSAGLPAILGG